MQGCMHFYCKKTILVARNRDQGGLVVPLGAEDVKRTEVDNLRGVQPP